MWSENRLTSLSRTRCTAFYWKPRHSDYWIDWTSGLQAKRQCSECRLAGTKFAWPWNKRGICKTLLFAVAWLNQNSTTLCRAENSEVELLWSIFHVRPTQSVLCFGASFVPEFDLLGYFSEFCHKEVVGSCVDFHDFVENFFKLGAWPLKASAGMGPYPWLNQVATIDTETLPRPPDRGWFSPAGSNIFCPNWRRSQRDPGPPLKTFPRL